MTSSGTARRGFWSTVCIPTLRSVFARDEDLPATLLGFSVGFGIGLYAVVRVACALDYIALARAGDVFADGMAFVASFVAVTGALAVADRWPRAGGDAILAARTPQHSRVHAK